MAFIAQNDKLKQEGQAGAEAGQASPMTGGGGGAAFAGGGSGGAQPGSGGSLGWTNLQSYITANRGATGTADALNKSVGGEISKEKDSLTQSANQAKQKAESEVQRSSLGKDQASQLVQQAGSGQSSTAVPQISEAVKDYSGPTQFAPGLGGKVQEYGSGLQDDQRFSGLLNAIYGDAAKGNINTGQRALQQQLDTNNDAVRSARQGLQGQFQDLTNTHQQTVQDTDSALKSAASTVGSNVKGLRDHLGGLKDSERAQMDKELEEERKNRQGFFDYVKNNTTYAPGGVQTSHTLEWDDPTEATYNEASDNVGRYNAILEALGLSDQAIKPAGSQYQRGRVRIDQVGPDGKPLPTAYRNAADPQEWGDYVTYLTMLENGRDGRSGFNNPGDSITYRF